MRAQPVRGAKWSVRSRARRCGCPVPRCGCLPRRRRCDAFARLCVRRATASLGAHALALECGKAGDVRAVSRPASAVCGGGKGRGRRSSATVGLSLSPQPAISGAPAASQPAGGGGHSRSEPAAHSRSPSFGGTCSPRAGLPGGACGPDRPAGRSSPTVARRACGADERAWSPCRQVARRAARHVARHAPRRIPQHRSTPPGRPASRASRLTTSRQLLLSGSPIERPLRDPL